MLLSFRFANHRSFRDEQQLVLTPVYDHPASRYEAVHVAGIFGANASGKSNVLDAMVYMRRMVIRSDRDVEPGQGLQRDPFRLVPAIAEEPSRYVVDLLIEDIRYTYGFTVDSSQVLEEWLFQYKQRKVVLFTRVGDKIDIENKELKAVFGAIADITAPTALFLSVVARFAERPKFIRANSSDALHAVYQWFLFNLIMAPAMVGTGPAPIRVEWTEDSAQKGTIIDLLKAADIGLIDVVVRQPGEEQEVIFPDSGDQVYIEAAEPRRVVRVRPRRPRLLFSHRGAEENILLDFADESNGTRQLLELAIRGVRVLRSGGLLLVDELDASLHSMLTAKLINLFQSEVTNPNSAQLVFSSHDATLLGLFDGEEVLKRDQVWFTEKSDEGASSLFPLSDYHPRREGENRQKRYHNGNYGAIPDLSGDLFAQALLSRGLLNDVPTNG